MEIKDIIADIRNKQNLTQEEMAEKLFLTRQAVSRWENGETTPNIDTLKMIANVFDVPADKLLGIDKNDLACQSCGMDLKNFDDFGTQQDGGINTDYCNYCYQNGAYTNCRTIDEMIESNLKFLDEYNKEKGLNYTIEQARTELKKHLSTLKRWKQ